MSVSEGSPTLVKNQLLAALPQKEYARLLPNLETVSLGFKEVLYESGAGIEHVYFLNNSVVSLLTIRDRLKPRTFCQYPYVLKYLCIRTIII
jgi:hypothetical protein